MSSYDVVMMTELRIFLRNFALSRMLSLCNQIDIGVMRYDVKLRISWTVGAICR